MSGRTEKGNKSTGFPSENEKTEVLPKCVTNQKATEAEKIEKLVFLKKIRGFRSETKYHFFECFY